MQVEPQNTIPLLYQITDPSDSTIYFIRATVYDSLTREAISTHNLVSRGDGLWSSTVSAPVDGSGLGRHIHVIIRVYTDSNYSILSDVYTQQIDKYLVKSHVRFGGGGQDVDYEKIKKIVDTSIAEKLESSDLKIEKVLEELLSKIYVIGTNIEEIIANKDDKDPEESDKPVDFSPISNELQNMKLILAKKIGDIEIEKPKDYSVAIKELGNSINTVISIIQFLTENNLEEKITEALDKVESLKKSISILNDYTVSLVNNVENTLDKKVNKEPTKGIFNVFPTDNPKVSKEMNKYF